MFQADYNKLSFNLSPTAITLVVNGKWIKKKFLAMFLYSITSKIHFK